MPATVVAIRGQSFGLRFRNHVSLETGTTPGADDGNRTRVASLEDWGSTIELRPHVPEDR